MKKDKDELEPKTATSQGDLNELFKLLVKNLCEKLKSGEASASDLSVARQFLKDNGIDSNIEDKDSPILNLLDSLPFDEQLENKG